MAVNVDILAVLMDAIGFQRKPEPSSQPWIGMTYERWQTLSQTQQMSYRQIQPIGWKPPTAPTSF